MSDFNNCSFPAVIVIPFRVADGVTGQFVGETRLFAVPTHFKLPVKQSGIVQRAHYSSTFADPHKMSEGAPETKVYFTRIVDSGLDVSEDNLLEGWNVKIDETPVPHPL